jgi:hypothetical protein
MGGCGRWAVAARMGVVVMGRLRGAVWGRATADRRRPVESAQRHP